MIPDHFISSDDQYSKGSVQYSVYLPIYLGFSNSVILLSWTDQYSVLFE